MALSNLKATLEFDFGGFKQGVSEAKTGMDSLAKTTSSTMSKVSGNVKKAASVGGGAFNKLAASGDKFRNKQGSLVGTIAKTGAAFVGIKSAADIFNSAIGRVDKIQSAEKSIKSLTGSQKDATTVMDGLQKVVDGTPLSLDAFTSSAKGMVAAGMDASKVEGVMTAVGDAAFGVGDGAPSIEIMSSAFKSLQSSGVASLGDLNRLMDQNIPVYKIIGNQLGKTTEETKKFITDGLLPSGKAIDMLTKGIEKGTDGVNGSTAKMAGQMKTAGDTISGAAGNIKTALVKSLAVPITASYEKIVNGMKGVKDGIKSAQPQIEAAFTAIAQIVEGVILGMVDTFNEIKPALESIISAISNVVDYFAQFSGEGENLTSVVRSITPTLVKLYAAFKGYQAIAKTASVLKQAKAAVTAFGDGQKIATAATKAWTVAQAAYNAVMNANPVVLIITAIVIAIAALVAGIMYLWKTNEGFRNAIMNIWNAVKSAFSTSIEAVKGFMSDMGQKISDVWNAVKNTFNSSVEAVKGFMASMGQKISEIWESIKSAFTTAVEFVKNVITVGFMLVQSIISGVMTVISSVIKAGWDIIVSIITYILDWIKLIIQTAWLLYGEVIMSALSAIQNFIQSAWDFIVNIFTTVFDFILGIIQAAWNGFLQVITTVLDAISLAVSTIWNVIVLVFNTVMGVLKSIISTAWTAISTVITTVMNAISSMISVIWQAIKTTVSAVVSAIASVISQVWNSIKSVISSVMSSISSIISSIWNTIRSTTTSVINGIKGAVSSTWNSIRSVTSSVWEGIKNAIIRPIENAKNAVSRIVDSIKGFFSNMHLRIPSIQMPPLPHFSLSGSFSLKPPSVPHLSVDWYATGGIATGASVVGIGEAGDEAIVPLSNKGRMKPFAQAVSSMIDKDSTGTSASTGDVVITGNNFVIREEADINKVAEGLHRLAKRERKS